ncbi:hypothetical protein NHQ30_005815 [Ciborinia camelliae]|nr:hypothetical protein NHQ30_005815 [Ciborinia camelliae]
MEQMRPVKPHRLEEHAVCGLADVFITGKFVVMNPFNPITALTTGYNCEENVMCGSGEVKGAKARKDALTEQRADAKRVKLCRREQLNIVRRKRSNKGARLESWEGHWET